MRLLKCHNNLYACLDCLLSSYHLLLLLTWTGERVKFPCIFPAFRLLNLCVKYCLPIPKTNVIQFSKAEVMQQGKRFPFASKCLQDIVRKKIALARPWRLEGNWESVSLEIPSPNVPFHIGLFLFFQPFFLFPRSFRGAFCFQCAYLLFSKVQMRAFSISLFLG